MNIALLASVVAATSMLAAPAQETPRPAPPPTPPSTPAPQASPPQAEPADSKTIAQATQILKDVAEAYRKAPALTDTLEVHAVHPMGEEKQELAVAFGPESSRLTLDSIEFTAVGGKLYVTRSEQDNKYFVTDLQGDMEQTLTSLTGQSQGMPAHFAMRAGAEQSDVLKRLTMGLFANPTISGLADVTDENGAKLQEIQLSDSNGSAKVHVNPNTKLIQTVVVKGVPPGAPPSIEMTLSMKFDPHVHEAADKPIAFEPGDRKAVDELADLRLAIGDPAPDFALETAEGKSVRLSELRGHAVVLDFWATWCKPCRDALPRLEEFSKWAESSGKKIKVFAINTMERSENAEATKTKATGYWTQQSFTTPLLLDLENKVAMKFEVQGLPTTFVIGPDGVIVEIHSGFAAEMVESLKKGVGEALGEAKE